MQDVKPVNIGTMKCDRKWKSRGKWIIYATDNWIGEAIVAQAIHEAMFYTSS